MRCYVLCDAVVLPVTDCLSLRALTRWLKRGHEDGPYHACSGGTATFLDHIDRELRLDDPLGVVSEPNAALAEDLLCAQLLLHP